MQNINHQYCCRLSYRGYPLSDRGYPLVYILGILKTGGMVIFIITIHPICTIISLGVKLAVEWCIACSIWCWYDRFMWILNVFGFYKLWLVRIRQHQNWYTCTNTLCANNCHAISTQQPNYPIYYFIAFKCVKDEYITSNCF